MEGFKWHFPGNLYKSQRLGILFIQQTKYASKAQFEVAIP